MARQKIDLNWKQIDALCSIQCTEEEIASVVGCSIQTLNLRCKKKFKITFVEYIKQKGSGGKASLRRKQWAKATEGDGNTTMLIWLGKQYLKQSDKVDVGGDTDKPFNLIYRTDKKLTVREKDDG